METGIFYAAIFDGHKEVVFNPERILREENVLATLSPQSAHLADVITVVATPGMEVFSNVVTQVVRCG